MALHSIFILWTGTYMYIGLQYKGNIVKFPWEQFVAQQQY